MRLALEDFRAWRERKNEMKQADAGALKRWIKRYEIPDVHGRLIDFDMKGVKPTKKDLLLLLPIMEKFMAEEISGDAERFDLRRRSRKT